MQTWLSFLLLLGCGTSACSQFLVPDKQFRCHENQPTCTFLPGHEEKDSTHNRIYAINYVEFNDKGQYHDKKQLSDALVEIDKTLERGPKQHALVVVYIHGWENNADEPVGCQDVCRFRDVLLKRLADEHYGPGGEVLPVLGIYLGWRGLTFTKEPFKHAVTYWHRRDIARHVGQTGMREAINAIEEHISSRRDQVVLILAGHSFGARVLENAVEGSEHGIKGIMWDYRTAHAAPSAASARSTSDLQTHSINPGLPADLILYLNAATSSRQTRRVLGDIRSRCTANPDDPLCHATPYYLAVTSHADWATKILMPVANGIFPALTADRYWLYSAANSPTLHTNYVDGGCDRQPKPVVCFTVSSAAIRYGSYQQGVYLLPKKHEVPGTEIRPFWIFNVEGDVMDSHGDAWNESVTSLVANVIAHTEKVKTLLMKSAN